MTELRPWQQAYVEVRKRNLLSTSSVPVYVPGRKDVVFYGPYDRSLANLLDFLPHLISSR
jgi:hypothetical protein